MLNKAKSYKYSDNVETENLIPIIKEFLESVDVPFDAHMVDINEIEWQSRDGFIAYDHNRGGMDLIAFTDVSSLIGSGEHERLAIADKVNEDWDNTLKDIKEENPDIDDDHLWDVAYEANHDDYAAYAWRVRVMYEGEKTLCIHVGYDYDAPYFRWRNKAMLELTVKYKDKADLKRKLARALKKVNETK